MEQALGEELSALQARHSEGESLVRQLREEGEKSQARLVEIEDAREVTLCELASLQSDLATLQSEKNTQRMATEAVSVVGVIVDLFLLVGVIVDLFALC